MKTKPIKHRGLILAVYLLLMPLLAHAATESRTALVIGNSAYSTGPLANPAHDAADVAATLKELGFSVTLRRNVGLRETEDAIREFGNQLKRGGVGLFYYAGHAIQMDGVNYLIPVGVSFQ
ncbi:MAG: caspase family protein, partial [Syntrophales bacterium LBB04]|nr:caspase family protein [Syntrophales bacterium LBB04]